MADNPNRSIEPFIAEAQGALKHAMDEACRTDLRKADTGELIRIEEALQTATNAAKEVVSLRLRRRSERGRDDARETAREIARENAGESSRESSREATTDGEEHRIIEDENGTSWAVVAVYPSGRTVDQGTLPDRFAHGWLLFEHGDDVRRHAPVPENWRSLTDHDLRQLCRNAEIATKRITPLKSPELGR